MNKNKVILKHCPNFYKIINFEFDENDKISEKLISVYKDFIFTINPDNLGYLKIIEKIDYILNKYIDDYYFRKEIKRDLLDLRVKSTDNLDHSIMQKIISIFDDYENSYTRNIYFARWI